MRFEDKVTIVTGGNSGIGRAISLRFAQEGASMVVVARNKERVMGVVEEIEATGGEALPIVADVTAEDQVERMVYETLDRFKRVDILINNAGIPGPTAVVVDLQKEDWESTLSVNLTGAMLCSREVLKVMIPRRRGTIINISSVAGKVGMPMRAAYCASKFGLLGLTQSMAMEVGIHNIRVNAICPGSVPGARMEKVWKETASSRGATYAEVVEEEIAASPLRSLVNLDQIAAMTIFMASDDYNETGQAVNFSAGFVMD